MKLIFTTLLFLFLLSINSFATNYYVDADSGNDNNNGTSSATPWKSYVPLNNQQFNAGDSIFFKSNVEIRGMFEPSGNGISNNPIYIGKYGGNEKAILNAGGKIAAISLNSLQGYEITALEIQNHGGEATGETSDHTRFGIRLQNYSNGIKEYFNFHDLYIHNVYPLTTTPDESNDPAYKGYGIQITTGSNNDTYIKDVFIDNVEIYNIGYRGIVSGRWSNPNEGFTHNQNFNITNCYIHNLGGSGIVPFNVKGLKVENNRIDRSGDTSDPRMIGRGSGIWMVRCIDVLIQYNQFLSSRGKKDSCGAHIDIGNENTIIQYNYSYDNEGGFAEIMGGNRNSIYRYNVSVNDGWRIKNNATGYAEGIIFWLSGYMGNGLPQQGSVNTKVYNNTIYIGEGITSRFLLQYGTENVFKNNLLHIDGELIYDKRRDVTVDFDYNIYSGNQPFIENFNAGSHSKVNVPSGIINPGGIVDTDYLINETSEAIASGFMIDDGLTTDYFNFDLSSSSRTIGAHEWSETVTETTIIITPLTTTFTYSGEVQQPLFQVTDEDGNALNNVGLSLQIEDDLSPIDVGEYSYTVTSNNPLYIGETSGSFTILKAPYELQFEIEQAVEYSGQSIPFEYLLDETIALEEVKIEYNGSEEVPVDVGVYEVIITIIDARYSGTFTGEFEIYEVENPTSIDKVFKDVLLLPNPTTGEFSLAIQESFQYCLYNLEGKRIEEGTKEEAFFDLSNHKKGIYFLIIKTKNAIKRKKVILK